MENLSPEIVHSDRLARDLLECCLEEGSWPESLLDELLAQGADRDLFRVVVERLADLFQPDLCRVYAKLFADVIARRLPGQSRGTAKAWMRAAVERRQALTDINEAS